MVSVKNQRGAATDPGEKCRVAAWDIRRRSLNPLGGESLREDAESVDAVRRTVEFGVGVGIPSSA
jgi:hypothetical protein